MNDEGIPIVQIDTSRPHPARMYDYYPGGRANRAFLLRAVRVVVRDHGIRQILDLGTGIPTSPNTHEIAQDIAPGTLWCTRTTTPSSACTRLPGSPALDVRPSSSRTSGTRKRCSTTPRSGRPSTSTGRSATASLQMRSKADISSYFEGFELLAPGLVTVAEWRTDADVTDHAVSASTAVSAANPERSGTALDGSGSHAGRKVDAAADA